MTDPPEDMFGKIMSISDTLMVRYYELLSAVPRSRVEAIAKGEVHPLEAKKSLAREIVERFHGSEAAQRAERFFEERFQRRTPHAPTEVTIRVDGDEVWICQLIRDVGFAASTSEARRLVSQGAVRVDGTPVDQNFRFRRGVHRLLEVGRRRVANVTLARDGAT